jgi:hypothetical protein
MPNRAIPKDAFWYSAAQMPAQGAAAMIATLLSTLDGFAKSVGFAKSRQWIALKS